MQADPQPPAEAIYEVRELHEIVLAAVRSLPNDQRQAVQMYYVDGLSLWDIGRLADVSVGAVKVRLLRPVLGCGWNWKENLLKRTG
jgi:RNA polymerase sigma factor (sigma-70 family)